MDAIFIDSNGNKKNFLYQYDVGQTFIVENFEYSKVPKVQFSIKSIKTAPSVSSKLVDSDLHVSIPDMLLTYGENIVAYLYIEDATKGSTIETIFISVIPRKRPADYIYTSEMFARSINGSIIVENSGIAEVAAWADSNTNNQNRTGYFVSVAYDAYNKSLIANKATSINDVYGVAVDKAGIALNCDESKLDNDGDLMLKYAYVCTSGFATVIDNGKCTVGQMCVPNSLGIAVASDDTVGYKVVSRIDDRHVLIFVDPCMQAINSFQNNVDDVKNSLNLHIENKNNPHLVTKAQIGLGNVNNTSDINKPVSEAQSKAIAEAKKAGTDAQSTIDQHIANVENPHSVTKAQVGLGNVDNTSDTDKPISTATQNALNAKADLVDGIIPLSQLPSQVKERRVVNTIADRDAITDKFANLQVYVVDATGDSTVSKGGADYLYDGANWIKTGESESMDVIISWGNITEKPTSFSPTIHADTHKTGGNDALSYSDIGAAAENHDHNDLYYTKQEIDGAALKTHASTHATGGTDAISPADIGAATQIDFDALKNKVDNLELSGGIAITDSVTGKQYTLGMQDGKLVVILIDDGTTTE